MGNPQGPRGVAERVLEGNIVSEAELVMSRAILEINKLLREKPDANRSMWWRFQRVCAILDGTDQQGDRDA